MWAAIILAFVGTAAVSDVLRHTIPRWLTVAAFLLGLGVHWYKGGFFDSLAAAVIAFGIGVAFFSLGAIGGGDVKLITALGAMLGLDAWLTAMEGTILAAGVIAFIQVVRRKAVRQTFRNIWNLLKGFVTRGLREHPEITVKNKALIRSPFAAAVALGTAFAIYSPLLLVRH